MLSSARAESIAVGAKVRSPPFSLAALSSLMAPLRNYELGSKRLDTCLHKRSKGIQLESSRQGCSAELHCWRGLVVSLLAAKATNFGRSRSVS